MASLALRNKSYRLTFCHHGQRYTFTIGEVSRREADNWSATVDQTLLRIGQGLLTVPDGADLVEFVKSGGKLEQPPPPRVEPVTLEALKDRYLVAHAGAMEENSLATVKMHLGHFVASFGPKFVIQGLTAAKLQEHIDRRKAKNGSGGKKLSPVTLKKEVATLRAVWNWGTHMGLGLGHFPGRGLVYPKADEKPPFMTWAEIERRTASGGNAGELWNCLYLSLSEIDKLLRFVEGHAAHLWVYPLFFFAAHTGARRSEMLRVRLVDLDLAGQTVVLHEKKRARGKRTTRRVPLSSPLVKVFKDWLKVHPGGEFLFCPAGEVFRSKKRSRTTGHQNDKDRPTSLKGRMATVRARELPASGQLTKDEASDHFNRTLAGSKWEVLRGWHVLRHSFVSNLASAGVDQRMIDEWVGHQTEEMRKRYRHLLPSAQRQVLDGVFGRGK